MIFYMLNGNINNKNLQKGQYDLPGFSSIKVTIGTFNSNPNHIPSNISMFQTFGKNMLELLNAMRELIVARVYLRR